MLYSGTISNETEVVTAIIVGISLLMALVIITLLTVFVKRKNKLVSEQERAKATFEKELAETEVEIREATLRNISWELHDNIGQLLALAKIQAQTVKEHPERIDEVVEIIGTSLNELRALSKLINPEAIKSLTLGQAIQLEVDRFNRMNFINASLVEKGETLTIGPKVEIILFRILQEFFSNTIKHSKAETLTIIVDYNNGLHISAKDNGIGFSKDIEASGIGLSNMQNRAKLIGASLKIDSVLEQGTCLEMSIPTHKIKTHE
ncbi:sensor histidine kinase [Patiriisocius marinus]|uniref:histidine kinase n=1 Tax=Patiriisocius marinus TaxID=1397112 RepID=A0A5J4J930_9FLAO|nr:ATP-binding protein [Patiriisocius marinus]GER61017.1 hypothetical protein ULMA_31250 [Patiriisocius marinus]